MTVLKLELMLIDSVMVRRICGEPSAGVSPSQSWRTHSHRLSACALPNRLLTWSFINIASHNSRKGPAVMFCVHAFLYFVYIFSDFHFFCRKPNCRQFFLLSPHINFPSLSEKLLIFFLSPFHLSGMEMREKKKYSKHERTNFSHITQLGGNFHSSGFHLGAANNRN